LLLINGDRIFPPMLAAIRAAHTSIACWWWMASNLRARRSSLRRIYASLALLLRSQL
jgi:hypothetical protein